MSYMDRYTKAKEELLSGSEPATTPASSNETTSTTDTSESSGTVMSAEERSPKALVPASPTTGSPTWKPKSESGTSIYGSNPLGEALRISKVLLDREAALRPLISIDHVEWKTSPRKHYWGESVYKSVWQIMRSLVFVQDMGESHVPLHYYREPKDTCPHPDHDKANYGHNELIHSADAFMLAFNKHTHPSPSGPASPPLPPGGDKLKYKPTVTLRMSKRSSGFVTNGEIVAGVHYSKEIANKISWASNPNGEIWLDGDSCHAFSDKYPHVKGCLDCGSDAYVGFSRVDCSNVRCKNHG